MCGCVCGCYDGFLLVRGGLTVCLRPLKFRGDLQSLCWPVRTRRAALQEPFSSSASFFSLSTQLLSCNIPLMLYSVSLLLFPTRCLASPSFAISFLPCEIRPVPPKCRASPPPFSPPHSFNTPFLLSVCQICFHSITPFICLGLGLSSHFLFHYPPLSFSCLCSGWDLPNSSYYSLSPPVLVSIFPFNVLRVLLPFSFFVCVFVVCCTAPSDIRKTSPIINWLCRSAASFQSILHFCLLLET